MPESLAAESSAIGGGWPRGASLVSPRAAVTSAFVAVLGLIFIVAGSAVWQTRRAAEESLTNVALTLERGVAKDLLAYDFMLDAIARNARQGDTQAMARQASLWRDLRTPDLGSIVVLDAAGVPLLEDEGAREHAAGLEASLAAHRADPSLELHAGAIGPGRTSGTARMLVSRRLNDAEGRFAGIVAGNVKLDYFRRALPPQRLGRGGNIGLLTLDGRLVGAASMTAMTSGMDLSRSQLMERLRTQGPGLFKGVSAVDGEERLYSAIRLMGLPFYLVAGQLASEVYADWNMQAIGSALLLLVLAAILGLLSWALHKEFARRRLAERKALEMARTAGAAAAELELITHHADDLILKVDWDGTRRFVSPASERMLGYAAVDMMRNSALSYVHDDDRPLLRTTLDDLKSGRHEIAQVNYRVQHRGGAWLNVEARCRALPDGSGAIVAVRDVTQRVALEEKLRQAQKMEGIGQLTAGVAHDFNNMLQGQMTGLEMLLDLVQEDAKAAGLAEAAIGAAEQGARLTHSLLAFARKQVLRPEAVDLPRLIAELEALLSRTLGPHIALETTIGAGVARPLADRAQLQSALLNLCLNARDAMGGKGGRIVVEACALPGAPQVVALRVSDRGPGIPADIMARVCEPFFTTKQVGQGSGLGLSMVQGFAQQSGGELQLRSAPGQGTTAEIRLPAAKSQAARASGRISSRDTARQDYGKLLLVDDDAAVLDNLGKALRASGSQVTQLAGGAAAEAVLRGGAGVDVLITDFGMPGMTGLELIRVARVLRPGLRAVLMTGYVDGERLDDVPAGVGVLRKPFRTEELLAMIGRLEGLGVVAGLAAVEAS